MSETFKWCLDKPRLANFGKRVFCIDNEHRDKFWCLNGEYHRENGPTIEWTDGTKMWYLNGTPHRVNGPAIELSNGDKFWCLYGKRYSESAYWKELRK